MSHLHSLEATMSELKRVDEDIDNLGQEIALLNQRHKIEERKMIARQKREGNVLIDELEDKRKEQEELKKDMIELMGYKLNATSSQASE